VKLPSSCSVRIFTALHRLFVCAQRRGHVSYLDTCAATPLLFAAAVMTWHSLASDSEDMVSLRLIRGTTRHEPYFSAAVAAVLLEGSTIV